MPYYTVSNMFIIEDLGRRGYLFHSKRREQYCREALERIMDYLDEKPVDYRVDTFRQRTGVEWKDDQPHEKRKEPLHVSVAEVHPKFFNKVILPELKRICSEFRIEITPFSEKLTMQGRNYSWIGELWIDWDVNKEHEYWGEEL